SAASKLTVALPSSSASTPTPGSASSVCLTRATQCPQLIPSMWSRACWMLMVPSSIVADFGRGEMPPPGAGGQFRASSSEINRIMTASAAIGLRCIRCHADYAFDSRAYLCPSCGAGGPADDPGILDVQYDYDRARQSWPSATTARS